MSGWTSKSGRQCRSRGTAGIGPLGGKSRWGHHGDFVVIFAPKFSSPGGRDVILFSLPVVVERFQRLLDVLLRDPGVARRCLNVLVP